MSDTAALSADAQAIIAAIEKAFAATPVVAPKSAGIGADLAAEAETLIAKLRAAAGVGESGVGHMVSVASVKAGIPRAFAWAMILGDIAAVAMVAKMFGLL